MDAVMIVNEIASDRQDLARALEAEGFRVVQTDSASAAVREIWEGSFVVVFIASVLTGSTSGEIADQLMQMAPEVETIVYSKNDSAARLARKASDIRDGVAAAV